MKIAILSVALLVGSLGAHCADIRRDSAEPKGESIAESLKKLSDVNMYHPPMHALRVIQESIPLAADEDQDDLEAIVSSRPFRKAFEYLSGMTNRAASEVVKRELSAAITEYLSLYERWMGGIKSPKFKAGYTNSQTRPIGPAFAMSNVPEGEAVIRGARYRVLALVWTSGMLRLTGCKAEVEQVARLAMKQRRDLYLCDDPPLTPFFKSEMLKGAGLYNRQIISTGLLGATSDEASEASLLKAAGAKWQARPLDSPIGSLTVEFTSPMDDAHFDILLKELHLTTPSGDQSR